MTCFGCGKVGHVVRDCPNRRRQVINIMDAQDEPLDYPVEQGDRVMQIKAGLNVLSLEEKGHLADEMDIKEDFHWA